MGFIRKAKWSVIGAVLFGYVLWALMFYSHHFYVQLSAYMVIGYVFGNWAGLEDKEQIKKEKKNEKISSR